MISQLGSMFVGGIGVLNGGYTHGRGGCAGAGSKAERADHHNCRQNQTRYRVPTERAQLRGSQFPGWGGGFPSVSER